jgi:hypothetical protein
MGSSWFVPRSSVLLAVAHAAALCATTCVLAPAVLGAQGVSQVEREALVRRQVERGGRAEDVEALLRRVDEAAAKGLPTESLTSKVREGLAKGADGRRIESVIGQMTATLATADGLVRELAPGAVGAERRAAVVLLAESLDGGVTVEDVRALRAANPDSSTPITSDRLAGSAKGLALIRSARLPAEDGRQVMAEAVRRGFRGNELLDLGRDVKRREREFQAGRASLRALRDAIARGERPETLLRDVREAPAAVRPEATRPDVERAAPARPETVRPEPIRPERPTAPERPAAPERPGR